MSELFPEFSPEEDNRVPGEVILKLGGEANLAVTESVPPGPARRADEPIPTRFGVSAVDGVLSELDIESITRIHSPISPLRLADAATGRAAGELSATYRLRLADADADLDTAIERLGGSDEILEAGPNRFRFSEATPNDPMFSLEWGLPRIRCPEAWDRTTGDAATVVAVLDTGVDLNHPDLASRLVAGSDLVDRVGVTPRPGFRWEGDFLTRDDDPQDEVGHGTHVAGTIGAASNNGAGVAGVSWASRIMPVKVMARLVRISDGRVTGSGTSVDIAAGIRWAVDHGAQIINMSLGGSSGAFVERDAVDYALSRDVVVVAAMGNDNSSIPSFPAAYPDVIAVGATGPSDRRAAFSNVGSHIDVVAPGVGIRSTDWDNAYSDRKGTSMASPHVAGVAALIRGCNPRLSAADIGQIIRATARPLRDQPADPVPNDDYGHGLLDARAAVDRACPRV